MKKKRGKKKAVSPKKKRVFFLFGNKVAPIVLACIFLALAIFLSIISTTGNAVNSSVTGQASVLDNPTSINLPSGLSWMQIGNTWREIIVFIIVLAIIFVMLYDILTLVSIFSNWVYLVIAIGLSIIAALFGWIRQASVWAIGIAAGMGVAAGFIEIIVSIVIFVGLVIGNNWMAKWAAKRKGQKEYVKSIQSSGQAKAAIRGLRELQKEFRKPQ